MQPDHSEVLHALGLLLVEASAISVKEVLQAINPNESQTSNISEFCKHTREQLLDTIDFLKTSKPTLSYVLSPKERNKTAYATVILDCVERTTLIKCLSCSELYESCGQDSEDSITHILCNRPVHYDCYNTSLFD